MRHASRTHRVALDWLFDRINLDSKIQIKYIDTKNQLADILTKGSFTRDEWNHLLNVYHQPFQFYSLHRCNGKTSSTRIRRRTCHNQIETYDEFDERTPSFVTPSASANPGRTSYGYQDPEKPVLDDRAGQPVETARSNYSQDYGLSWSSQVWKSGDGEHDRPGQPDQNSWDSLGKVDPHRGEFLGRTAHSARNEETIPDRTGKPASEDVQG